jgi:hypothetical protein
MCTCLLKWYEYYPHFCRWLDMGSEHHLSCWYGVSYTHLQWVLYQYPVPVFPRSVRLSESCSIGFCYSGVPGCSIQVNKHLSFIEYPSHWWPTLMTHSSEAHAGTPLEYKHINHSHLTIHEIPKRSLWCSPSGRAKSICLQMWQPTPLTWGALCAYGTCWGHYAGHFQM